MLMKRLATLMRRDCPMSPIEEESEVLTDRLQSSLHPHAKSVQIARAVQLDRHFAHHEYGAL